MNYPTLHDLQIESYECSKASGWHEPGADENPVIKLALVHSEISEAVEEYRDGNMGLYYNINGEKFFPDNYVTTTLPKNKPEGFGIELADAVIRLLDLAQMQGIELSDYIQIKQAYNRTREYRHGGKRI